MNRAYALLASLILIATPMAGCLSGEDLEEIVDDVLGCMDENAANYEENATAELVGDCIYMATTETFIEAMTDMGSIEDMLEESPKAGYSQSISSSEWNQDLGMQMDVQIEDIVMADLDNDSVYVHNSISIVGLLQMEYTHVQVGEVVNVHLLVGGMMVQGEATTGSYQTRDATPNVLEVIAEQGGLFSEGGLFNDGGDDDGDDDDGDLPEDAENTITMSDDMETQTMTMEYTEGGAEITMTIHIDQNQDLMSMSMETENGSATSSITYEVMWGVAIVIEVDETLPKTSIPVWLDFAGEDEFVCGSGRQSRWIGSMTATLIVKTVQTNQTITTTTTTVTTTTTTTMMMAIISVGAVIMTATVNGRVTQTMARTGGPVRRTHLFRSGITGGTTVNSMMRIGSVRMNTGKIRITSTQQITTTTIRKQWTSRGWINFVCGWLKLEN